MLELESRIFFFKNKYIMLTIISVENLFIITKLPKIIYHVLCLFCFYCCLLFNMIDFNIGRVFYR